MKPIIVSENEPITLVGGARVSQELFSLAHGLGSRIIAADSGAKTVLDFGQIPDKVIGDLDSLPSAARTSIDSSRIIAVSEQDSTDFDKVLMRVEAPIFIGVGFLGDRIDHELAALSSLVRFAHKRIILVGEEDAIFSLPPRFQMDFPMDERVSLFPLSQCRVSSRGLYWPTDGLDFDPMSQIGTSNKSTGALTLKADKAGMLVILPVAYLHDITQALRLSPTWPHP